MNIKQELPPMYTEVKEQFEVDDRTVVYTYGDIIYNPANVELPIDILVHEETHKMQQERIGGPEKWWELYLKDYDFRRDQEIEAYGEQYLYYCTVKHDRNDQARMAMKMGQLLASPMYNARMTTTEAVRAIRGWGDNPSSAKYEHREYPTEGYNPQKAIIKENSAEQTTA